MLGGAYGRIFDGGVGRAMTDLVQLAPIIAVVGTVVGIAAKLVADRIDSSRRLIEERIAGLQQRWEDANASRNEQIHELRESSATSEARLAMHATKIAIIETKLGLSPRQTTKPGE